jgi:RNA polymerase sigma factor (sigma-70 family)
LLKAVIRDIVSGHRDRFREIVREYGDDLLRVAFHFVHDWDEAKDITQRTFIACYENLRRYDETRPFRPWLLQIHVNQCRSAARRRKRLLLRFFDLPEEPVYNAAETGDEELIWRQIHSLSAKQQAAFVLIEIEQMSAHDAALILKCAESTLRVHLARAKQNLRHKLHRLGIGHEPME